MSSSQDTREEPTANQPQPLPFANSPSASIAPTTNSEDSDTVILNNMQSTEELKNQPASIERPPTLSRTSTFGIKKCWICVGDSTEDDPAKPPIWRSPCKCSLTAHEDCLLDWVADLENPQNRRTRGSNDKILCPQCKSEIKIARPKSYIVNTVKSVDRAFGRLVLPGLGASLLGTVFAGCWVHGFQSVYMVFGRDEAERLFKYAERRPGALFSYGLIPLNLIFARTRYSDFILPSGTLYLLATQLNEGFEIDWTLWPPLPSTVFACIPAVRSLYNWSYDKAFGELNRKWLREVQPRREEGFEGQEQNIADIMNEQEQEAAPGNMVLEVEVNIGGGDEDDDGEDDLPMHQPGAFNDDDNDDHHNHNRHNNGENADNPNAQQNAHVHHILGDRGDEIMEGTSSIGQSVLGSLLFPAVAAGMGGLLNLALPTTWTSSGFNFINNGRLGLLRTRWGRSVVGGCLFIVLKDAIMLYCRWRLAQGHRSRKIMDYDKQTKTYTLSN